MNGPPSGYSFARLHARDVDLLKQLLSVFSEAFGDPVTYQRNIPDDTYLAELLAKAHFFVLVAMHEGGVVAGLAAYELEKFEQDRREIYIYDLAVLAGHRRRGVARWLIQELRQIAKARRAYVIYVQADAGDTPAIRLYESLGTREDVHHFDIAVEESPAGPKTS